MKFKVSRTSVYSDDKKPCEGAKKETYTEIDIRTLGSFQKFDDKHGERHGSWLLKGEHHCVNEEGYIQREFPDACMGWFLEINTLEDLIEFQKEHGDIVIGECCYNPNIIEIEIYDDFRE